MKKMKMKKGSIVFASMLFIALLLFIPGCLKLEKKELKQVYETRGSVVDISKPLHFGSVKTFRGAYDGIRAIDEKYNTDFKKEALFGLMVNDELIPHIKRDLDALRGTLDATKKQNSKEIIKISPIDRTEKQLAILFIDSRMKMIESQEEFHKGYSFGMQGIVGDGFYCGEEPIIAESLQAFNRSAVHAGNAKYYFDELLTNTQDITWELVGVQDEKPLFYYSPVEMIFAQVKINKRIIEEYCHDEKRLAGKNPDKVFINFQGTKHIDLFISPKKAIPPKMWNILTEPVSRTTKEIELGALESIE